MPRRLGSPQKGSWDYGVDYEATYKELVKLLRSADSSKCYAKCYAAISLIALRNGARIGEAIEAFTKFLQGDATTRRLEDGRVALITQVRVEKHRKEDYRLIVFPAEILEQSFDTCTQLVAKGRDAVRAYVNRWLREKLGTNCHSLRYAFITYMLKKGVSPAIIASITKHRNLNMILKYVQEKVAERELLQL
jgi:integrase